MFLFKVLFFDIKGSMLHEILKKKIIFLPVQSTQNLPVPWSFTIFFIKAKPKSNPLPRGTGEKKGMIQHYTHIIVTCIYPFALEMWEITNTGNHR